MTRLTGLCGPLFALCVACAGHAGPVASVHASKQTAEACPTFAKHAVSSASARRLAAASNVLEYENIWKDAHPGSTTGSIGGSAVRALIHSKLSQLEACYRLALDDSGQASGRVVVRFVIDPRGEVAHANIGSNSFGRPDIGCCVLARVAQWRFAAPRGDGFVAVEYPFVVRVSYGR